VLNPAGEELSVVRSLRERVGELAGRWGLTRR
jgi:hypothetical protein